LDEAILIAAPELSRLRTIRDDLEGVEEGVELGIRDPYLACRYMVNTVAV
jgi:hypothetical protein